MFNVNTSNKFYDSNKGLIDRFLQDSGKKLKWVKPVAINFLDDEPNSNDPLGRTAFYDPEGFSVSVYTTNRHPKDILRSMAHELIHHVQNCRGEFEELFKVEEGYAQKDQHLRKMEKEAYLKGNMYFRDWEDSYKNGKNKMKINEMAQQPTTNQRMNPKQFAQYWVERKNSTEIKPLETQLLFYNARILLLNTNDNQSIVQFLQGYKYLTGEGFSTNSNPYSMKNGKNEYEIMEKLIGNIINRAKEMRLMENKKLNLGLLPEKNRGAPVTPGSVEDRERDLLSKGWTNNWWEGWRSPSPEKQKEIEQRNKEWNKPASSPVSPSKPLNKDLDPKSGESMNKDQIDFQDIGYAKSQEYPKSGEFFNRDQIDFQGIGYAKSPTNPTKRVPQQLSSPLINKIRKQLNVAIKGFGGSNTASFKELPEGTVLGPRTFAAMNIVRTMKKLPPYSDRRAAFKDLQNFSRMLSKPDLMDDEDTKTPGESSKINPSVESHEGLTPTGEDDYYQMEEGTKYMGYKPNQLVIERAELLEKKVWARLIEGKQNVWEDDVQEEETCPDCEKTDCKCEK